MFTMIAKKQVEKGVIWKWNNENYNKLTWNFTTNLYVKHEYENRLPTSKDKSDFFF